MKTVNWAILAPGSIAHKMAEAMQKSKDKTNLNLYAIGSRDIKEQKNLQKNMDLKKHMDHIKNC